MQVRTPVVQSRGVPLESKRTLTLTEYTRTYLAHFDLANDAKRTGTLRRERVALIAALNKGHELPVAQKFLRSDAVYLGGCVVTADPLHFQREFTQFITQE